MDCFCGAEDCEQCHPENFSDGVFTLYMTDEEIEEGENIRADMEIDAHLEREAHEAAGLVGPTYDF